MWLFIIIVAIIVALAYWASSSTSNETKTEIIGDMKKFNHRCPFCKKDIPKLYQCKTITKRKRHRVKIRTIREVVGEDWANHVKTCWALKEFLNKTKE